MSQDIAPIDNQEIILQDNTRTQDFLLNTAIFRQIEQFSSIMASGKATVPQHLKGNAADCMAVTMQALQWGMNPFPVAQKTHLVNGTLGYEAQLVNAVITSSNAIEGRFHYRYSESFNSDTDPNAWVQVGAVIKGEEDIQWGERVYPAKQNVKNSPLWKSDPKQQTAYLAIKKWARLYTPAVIMGVYTSDELREIPHNNAPKDITPKAMNLGDLTEEQSVEEVTVNAPEEETDAGLSDVLDAITSATDKISLKAAAEKARALPDELQLKAMPVYQEKLEELRSQAAKAAEHDETNSQQPASAAGIFGDQ